MRSRILSSKVLPQDSHYSTAEASLDKGSVAHLIPAKGVPRSEETFWVRLDAQIKLYADQQ